MTAAMIGKFQFGKFITQTCGKQVLAREDISSINKSDHYNNY